MLLKFYMNVTYSICVTSSYHSYLLAQKHKNEVIQTFQKNSLHDGMSWEKDFGEVPIKKFCQFNLKDIKIRICCNNNIKYMILLLFCLYMPSSWFFSMFIYMYRSFLYNLLVANRINWFFYYNCYICTFSFKFKVSNMWKFIFMTMLLNYLKILYDVYFFVAKRR